MAGKSYVASRGGVLVEEYSLQQSLGPSSAGGLVALGDDGLIDPSMLPASGGGDGGGIDIGQIANFTFDEPIVQLGSRVFVREGYTTDLENAAPNYKGAIISGFSDWFISDVEELGTTTQLNSAYSINGTTIVVGQQGSVYRSTDGGVTFYKMTGPWTTPNFQAVVSNGLGRWFIYNVPTNSFISNDDGITWELAPELPGGIQVKTLRCAGDNLIAALSNPGTAAPLIRSNNFGLTWSASGIVPSNQVVSGISADPDSEVLLVAYSTSGSTTAGTWRVVMSTGTWASGSNIFAINISSSPYPNWSGNSIGSSDGKFWLKHLEVVSGTYSDVFSTMDAEGSTVFQEVSRLSSTLQSAPIQFFQMGTGTGYIESGGGGTYRQTHRATADDGGSWQSVARGILFPGSGSSFIYSAAEGLGKIPVMCGRGMIVAAKPRVGLHLGSPVGPKPAARYVRIK